MADPEIVSSRFRELTSQPDDPIRPTAILHNIDEIDAEETPDVVYNYLVYAFERDGAVCKARTYLDTIEEVSVFGPFAGPDDLRPIEAPGFRADVLSYLKRRFRVIQELREDGYHTIWER